MVCCATSTWLSDMQVQIRPLVTIDEARACEEIQFQTWRMTDYREVVPLHIMVAMVRGGGLLLGAFDGGELLGFVFGFLGLMGEGRLKHYSHMLAVLPQSEGRGIGQRLKWAQREAILARGLDMITWTYDPLEARNAFLNLAKLGVICRTYIRDLYGTLADGLNAGLPTDRFEVEWRIVSRRVVQRLAGERNPPLADAVVANITRPVAGGFREPGKLALDLDAPAIQIEVPANYQAIKAGAPPLALEWRLAAREMFETYFGEGYTAVDFCRRQAGGSRRSFYILARESAVA
jgi:predicted GNAT superfamily acetyltransferase